MNKEIRKKLEANIISSIEQTLSQESHAIAGKMKKLVKAAGKKISKKFFKTMRAAEKKTAKPKKRAPAKTQKPRSAKAAKLRVKK